MRSAAVLVLLTTSLVVPAAVQAGAAAPPNDWGWNLPRISQRDFDPSQPYVYEATGYGVDVYVLSTGIRTTHNEFRGRAKWGATFGPYQSKDGNGAGTLAAAVVGGTTYGVAKQVSLIAVKVMSGPGNARTADVLDGIDFVVRKAAITRRPSAMLLDVSMRKNAEIDQAIYSAFANYDIHVIVPAGNDGGNACIRTPSGVSGAITVAGLARGPAGAEKPASGSNTGPCIDFLAPGEAIMSASSTNDTSTKIGSGTSLAAAHAAGAVALRISAKGNLKPRAMADALKDASTKNRMATTGLPGTPNSILYTLSH
ncbi:S8 family peptidase [Nonomuraea sp. NPDC050404]|uniref:S8 family peptidase n=1 Tax=Nonomuraea sp. NPDC050404 TaxID=3155783 RepID=UPI0033E14523